MSQMTQHDLETNVRRELPLMSQEDARELARILQRLIDALQPERIHVFGSQACGDTTPDSDVDLLVVVPFSNEPPYRRAQAAYHAMAGRKLSVDVLVMTREEFDSRAPALASLPATVLREGKLVYAA
jgi:uncharacterized protein